MQRKDVLTAVAIVVAFALFGVFIVRSLAPPGGAAQSPRTLEGPQAGSQVALTGVEWARGDRTLLLVLSKGCHFCSESARFYRRLAREARQRQGDVQLVAVLPQDEPTARGYLAELGVDIGEVRTAPLDALKVPGTPTLILVDRSGKVLGSWVGQLPPDGEEEVVGRLLGWPTA